MRPSWAPGFPVPGEGQSAWEAGKLCNALLGVLRFPDARTVECY